MLVAASNPQALWYLTRGFGLVTLILLTASTVIGMTQIARVSAPGLQRFVVAGIHRNISLLAIVFLAVHIVTAVADSFVSITLIDVFVPFVGHYRPIWLGMGALATDLLIALALSSLIRQSIGYQAWRAIHWAAYACWPVAIVHGLGTGSDTKAGWVQAIYVACALAVLAALGWRLSTRWSTASASRRLTAGVSAIVITVVVGLWAVHGPMRAGWSKKAGTTSSLLGIGASNHPSPATRLADGGR